MICTANNAAFVLDYAIFWLHTSELGGAGDAWSLLQSLFVNRLFRQNAVF